MLAASSSLVSVGPPAQWSWSNFAALDFSALAAAHAPPGAPSSAAASSPGAATVPAHLLLMTIASSDDELWHRAHTSAYVKLMSDADIQAMHRIYELRLKKRESIACLSADYFVDAARRAVYDELRVKQQRNSLSPAETAELVRIWDDASAAMRAERRSLLCVDKEYEQFSRKLQRRGIVAPRTAAADDTASLQHESDVSRLTNAAKACARTQSECKLMLAHRQQILLRLQLEYSNANWQHRLTQNTHTLTDKRKKLRAAPSARLLNALERLASANESSHAYTQALILVENQKVSRIQTEAAVARLEANMAANSSLEAAKRSQVQSEQDRVLQLSADLDKARADLEAAATLLVGHTAAASPG